MSALDGQVALVTGASSGLGRATAAALARAGAALLCSLLTRSVTSVLLCDVAPRHCRRHALSLIGVGTALYFAGVTLNLMSLGGLAIGVGMLVDNAVVVLEASLASRALGKTASEAAADGGSEVGAAIVAGHAHMVVFIPLTFVKDLTGQLFKDLALTVRTSSAISLIVALTVVPAAYAHWEGRRKGLRPHQRSAAFESPVSIPPGLPEAALVRSVWQNRHRRSCEQPSDDERALRALYQNLARGSLAVGSDRSSRA